MGARVPDAGADLLPGGIRLWVGCEEPAAGPGYHIAARPDELLTLAEWVTLQQALAGRNVQAVVVALNSTAAAPWWARAVPVLRQAWLAQTAAVTLWQAPTVLVATQWVGPSPIWSP